MSKHKDIIGCTLKRLCESCWVSAAEIACQVNPANAPRVDDVAGVLTPQHVAVLTSKYWGAAGVKLGVRFLDTNDSALKNKIVSHMNAWGQKANVRFSESSQGEVRIARAKGGYWSYLGTDILSITRDRPTMNLEGFSLRTSDAEFVRVVRHETGHTLGFPHEHPRAAIVGRLDPARTIDYFRRTQGWSEQVTRQQVLTPLAESGLISTTADETSIMCYSFPAAITRDGRPIMGGADINDLDHSFASRIYPLAETPPPPPPGKRRYVVEVEIGTGELTFHPAE